MDEFWEAERMRNNILAEMARHRFGYLYAMQSDEGGPIKIGSTYGTPQERLTVIRRQCGLPLRIVWVLGILGDLRRVEKTMHRFFASERITGEWFHPSPRLIQCLERLECDAKEEFNAWATNYCDH
jgi:hypothetical protein